MGEPGKRPRATGGRPMLVASSILTAIFNTMVLLLIARKMGAELLGTLGFLLAFVGMFSFAGDMGNHLAFERLLKKGFRFRDVFSTFTWIKIKGTAGMGILAGALIGVYMYLGPQGHTAIHPISLFIILGYFITASLAQIWVVGLAMRRRPLLARSFDLVEGLVKVVMVGGMIVLPLASGDQTAIFMLSMIYLIAGAMGLMIIRNNARYFKKGERTDEIIVEFNDEASRLAPYAVFAALLLSLDKVLLWFLSDPGLTDPVSALKTLGIYFGAQRITIFIAASAVSIQSLVGGALERYIESNDDRSISETLRMTERYVSLVVLPVAAFYILFSGDLPGMFLGVEFAGAGNAVALLAGAGFITAMAAPHMTYLVKADRVRMMTGSVGLALLVLVIGMAALVPVFFMPAADIHGINGTAISMLAAAIAGYLSARYFTWKLLDCRPHRRILVHIFCAGLMVMVIEFLIWYFGITMELIWLLAFALIGTLIYGLGLYLCGEMLKKDYAAFTDLTGAEK